MKTAERHLAKPSFWQLVFLQVKLMERLIMANSCAAETGIGLRILIYNSDYVLRSGTKLRLKVA